MKSINIKFASTLFVLALNAACAASIGEEGSTTADASSADASAAADTSGALTGSDAAEVANGIEGVHGGGGDGTASADIAKGNDASPTADAAQVMPPTVVVVAPVNGAIGVPTNEGISATFSTTMDPTSLNPNTFTLTSGPAATPVAGKVNYADGTATFVPNAPMLNNTQYTAAIATQAKSAHGLFLANKYAWNFTTSKPVVMGLPVNLATAGNFAILAKSAISTVPKSTITGNIGVSPAAATFITGFSLTADATNVFSTASQVTGKVYASNYAVPTPANMTAAISNMQLAFTDAAGRAPDVTELGAGNIGGKTLTAGVYKWGTGLLIPTNVTLTGSATDVWIFQIAKNLTVASGVKLLLAGGALPKNIFWQVAGYVDLGTTAHFEGVILCQTAIVLRTGASINGRLLAQTAVNIDGATVVQPAQ